MFKPNIILMDGSAFLFRSYFANKDQGLANQEGFPTGAIFGVLNSIKYFQRTYPNAKLIVIFDEKGKNFRHELYPEYKSHRKPMEDELRCQIEPLYEIVKAMDLPLYIVKDVEADDVIATLAQYFNKQNIKTLIASGDKDLYQLLSANVYQLDMKNNLIDVNVVEKKLGIKVEQVLDYLSLIGDSADNIKGIPSVGPKTAVKWLLEYQNIAGIKKNAEKITGKVGEKLRENFNELDLAYKLISLKYDVELDLSLLDKTIQQNNEKLIDLYQKYNFKSWLNQLNSKKPEIITNNEDNFVADKSTSDKENYILTKWEQILILEQNQLNELITEIKKNEVFVFDTETNSLDSMMAKIVGLVFGIENKAYYLPLTHQYLGVPKQLNIDEVLTILEPIFADENIKKIGQNLKYDAHILANYEIKLNGIVDDTMLKSYCLNSVATKHNLDDLSQYYLNHKTISFKEVAGSGKKQITFDEIHLEQAQPYACEDVIITSELNTILSEKLKPLEKQQKIYQDLEIPLIPVLLMIERNGVKLDVNLLTKQQIEIKQAIDESQKQAFKLADKEFNLDSPKQVQEVLFSEEGLGLKPSKKTAKGSASTNEEALKKLEHPLADIILKYRGLTKLNSTYLEALPKQININTNRLHTSYHQSGTITGRLSSSNPNLQNIPIRSKEGKKIRQAFITEKNNIIIAADYSQIELRIMAHLSGDEGLLNAFSNNIDIHKATAAQMFEKPLTEITADDRRNAKAINFGLIYGMSAHGLAKQINTSRTEAKKYMDSYFAKYPKVLDYIENTQNLAKEQGFVETILGRRLYLPNINAKNKMLQQHALRTAINAPMQGSSADIIKSAMLDIYNWIQVDNPKLKMTMQVHDELVFEVNKKYADEYAIKIKKLMENTIKINVPLVVDIGMGNNWEQAH
ncbi:DNA polymerase I [hydrothermal vent metagenome]|uniref:DNA-directed DNA polymerase n=1 Tax=hydrothermal vent metagenome TaxID=652676 RepID=A0A1W1BVA2_9ZZZZ